jgi:hypothetical protein
MYRSLTALSLGCLLLASLSVVLLASAGSLLGGEIVHAQTGVGGSGGGDCPPGQLCNPLKFDSITEFLIAVIEVILIFAVPIIIFFIMYAGFMYVTARGDVSKVSTAHSALTWAVVGGVIALGAKLIIEVIQGTIATF